MLKNELRKKIQAVVMAAIVTFTTVGAPAVTFADELPGETVVAEFSDGEEASGNSTGDAFSAGTDITVQSSDEDDQPAVFADENSDGSTEDGSAEAEAQEYLKANFIDGDNKIMSNGGTGVTKSEDGLTYNVGLTIPTNGSVISSMRLKYLNTVYKTGWYISKDNPYVVYKAPATNTSRGISRPSAEEGPYSFTATLKLFDKNTDDSAINDGSATALATQDFTIILAAEKKKYTVNVKPVDAKTGAAVEGASVDIQKNWNSLKPESDGSYILTEEEEYTLIVTAEGYDKYTQTFTPTVQGDMEVKLSPIIYRNTTFAVTGNDGAVITDADITLKEGWYTTLKPQEDGSYKLQVGKEYKYTITKDGYKDASGSFTVPDEDGDYTFPVVLESNIDPADQAAVDAVKKAFDAEFGSLRPIYGTDSNIADTVLARIQNYTLDVDVSKVKVSLESTEDSTYIGTDGTIHYVTDGLGGMGVYSKNISCTFKFTCNSASAVSDRTVTVGWDREYFKGKMQAEADSLTWDSIKGNNESQEEVDSDLTLPGCMGSNARSVWSEITWESSEPDVISIQAPSIDSMIYPRTGKIQPKTEDTEVTLTATFKANSNVINDYFEKVDSFGTITKTFKVTVKGTGNQAPTEEELKALLDKYYTAESLQDFNSKEQLDTANCTGDIQLPRYTRIKDENGDYVFANKEITVTSSDPELLKVNGYRVAVDMFKYEKDTTANLIVTFTREGVTAVKEIPITVATKGINEALDKELAMMDYAKAHYFDGIKGDNTDADNITQNLQAFQEMYLDSDGNAVWVHNADDKTGAGIGPDDYFDDPWVMEGQGYNHFISSDISVIKHENLVVTRPESNTRVTISSLLSSEKYGQFAKDHPDNEKLQKLYKQEVSVTVTVKGTKAESEALKSKIEEANALLETITEGTDAGQYPEGTKKKLADAITAAQAVLDDTEAEEAQQTAAIAALVKAMKDCRDSRISQTADVTAIVNTTANTAGEVQKITVKSTDAAIYGYAKPEAYQNEVTALDAFADIHAAMYGDEFKADPEKYLKINESGWVTKMFGADGGNIGFLVNNTTPVDASGMGSLCNNTVLKNGDVLNVFVYNDPGYGDRYLYFDAVSTDIMADKAFDLNVKGSKVAWGEAAAAQKDVTVELRDSQGNVAATGITDEEGNVSFKVVTAGNYTVVITKAPYDYYIPVNAQISVKAHEHSYTAWKKESDATVFEKEKQEQTCKWCGEKNYRYTGEKLEPTVKLSVSKLTLKTKQSKTVKVTGLANGDSVKSWKSSDTSVATVDKNGKITATKKEGTAVIKVTLASKKTAKVAVTVKFIRTKKITKVPKTLNLTAGKKYALKPVVTPSNSQQKVTYKSSNTKIATVSATGVIKAKRAGKVTVRVQSGKQKAYVKVTVKPAPALKAIKNVPTKKTIVKDKTYTLKPQLYPAGSIAKITYTSSNTKVASVDTKGKITAVKKGTAVITVKAGKFTVKCKVTVK